MICTSVLKVCDLNAAGSGCRGDFKMECFSESYKLFFINPI